MVGDLVRVNRDGLCIKKDTIVQVRGIDGDDKIEEKGLFGAAHCRPLDGEQFDGGIWIDYLKPIPLNPEILEKNGFSFCTRDGGYYLYAAMSYGFDVEVILFDVVDKYASIQLHIGDTDDTATYLHLMECNYTHQLQHALKVVGIDKEITI